MSVLARGGVVSIAAYVGHPGGMAEYEALRHRITQLDASQWLVAEASLINVTQAPILLLVYRK